MFFYISGIFIAFLFCNYLSVILQIVMGRVLQIAYMVCMEQLV
jgi:hypothetical protein